MEGPSVRNNRFAVLCLVGEGHAGLVAYCMGTLFVHGGGRRSRVAAEPG